MVGVGLTDSTVKIAVEMSDQQFSNIDSAQLTAVLPVKQKFYLAIGQLYTVVRPIASPWSGVRYHPLATTESRG